jgi:hypothetical protein
MRRDKLIPAKVKRHGTELPGSARSEVSARLSGLASGLALASESAEVSRANDAPQTYPRAARIRSTVEEPTRTMRGVRFVRCDLRLAIGTPGA